MQKTEPFPCKLSSQLEFELAEMARDQEPKEADQALQEQWRAAALKLAGTIERGDLSAENAGSAVEAKLMRRYAR